MSKSNNKRSKKDDIFSPRHNNKRKESIIIPGVRESDLMIPSPRRTDNSHVSFGSMRTLYEETPSSVEAAISDAPPSERKSLCTYLSEKFCFSKNN